MAVNKKQLAICKQRGHYAYLSGGQWSQCKYGHIWLREIRTIEESETEPPEEDQSEFHRLKTLRQEVGTACQAQEEGLNVWLGKKRAGKEPPYVLTSVGPQRTGLPFCVWLEAGDGDPRIVVDPSVQLVHVGGQTNPPSRNESRGPYRLSHL